MLEKRIASLSQVEGVLLRIQEASDNVAMVKAMEGGAAVLKSLNKETGGVETVDRIVDSLQEEMERVEEVSGTMESVGPTVNESAVDEELEALEEEAKKKEESESAEKIKSQLDEIPKFPASVGKDTKESTNEADTTLEEDIARLERLSVEEPRKPSRSNAVQKEQEATAAT
jgi:charged multivesicular body protein 7